MEPLLNKSWIFFVVILFICPAVTAPGKVIYVDDDAPADFNNIQAAIDDANDADAVIVADGIYRGAGNRDIDFKGKAITVRSENGPESCVIDCQGTQADCHRGFTFHSGEDANSILTGFTITNGYGPVDYVGNSPQLAGGAIYCSASSPSISNCIMTGNSAAAGGAVCCSHGARPQIVNCRLTYNFGQGGAINCRDSAPEIVNCVVADNQAPWYCDPLGMWCLDVYGGGFYCSNCRATIRNCTIVGNWASGEGDGLYTYGLKPILRNCILCTGPDEIAGSGAIVTYSTFSCAVAFAEWGYLDPNGTPDDPTDDFYVYGDYHLKSQAGRWDPKSQSWVQDDVTSPCIDSGHPADPVGHEPFPNGGRINMGAYGGTIEASKSYFGEPICETIIAGDINGDCKVDFADLAIMAMHWLQEKTVSFQGLGDLPGGVFRSTATGISADGSVVVGYSRSSPLDAEEAFRWENGVMRGLGHLSSSISSRAYGVSADGSVVVGSSGWQAFRWEHGTMEGLGDLPGGGRFQSMSRGVSSDGSVVVGRGQSDSGWEAFRWENGVMVGLSDLPGGGFYSCAVAVSADGSVVVGVGYSDLGSNEAFRWENGLMVGLGDLPGGNFGSIAYAVSADGSVIVGKGYPDSGSAEAFCWENGVMVGLGDLPGGIFSSVAYGVSADGSVVVGGSISASGPEAFIWDADNGIRSIRDLLVTEYGLDLTGWSLFEATGISADGLTIVGTGINPDGYREAWVATVPEPTTVLLGGVRAPIVRNVSFRMQKANRKN